MYYGPKKVISVDDSLVVLYDRQLDVNDIRREGMTALVIDDGYFLLVGSELVIPIEQLIRPVESLSLVIVGGDADQLYPQEIEKLHLDARMITKLEVWMEMSKNSGVSI